LNKKVEEPMRDNNPTDMTADALLERAREIAQMAAEQTQAIEQQRRLPDELMQALKDSGLLRILQPAHWGGYERDLRTFIEVATEISKGDTSTGWVYCILGIHNFWISYVEPQLQEEIWGKDSSVLMADSFAPTGTAQEVSGGYQLNGQWSFLSGLWCSDWVAVGARVAPKPDALPEWTMMFVPKTDYRLNDQWHVVGMQGTDSNTIVVENAFVPHHRVYWLERAERTGTSPGQQLHPNALYQLPFIPTLGVSLVPVAIGSARSAIAHFQEWTRTRVPVYGPSDTPQPGTASTHIALAEAVTTVDALEGLMLQCTDELVAKYGHGRQVPTAQERAKYYGWRSYIARHSTRVVDRLFELSGGRSLYLHHPVQRIWRDLHAVSQHIALHYESGMEVYGRTLVGLPSGSAL
jgi:3-hydroxy-9,10-secoandrosta-1,3,5(10)-triene-9,17-dione monooxygenase